MDLPQAVTIVEVGPRDGLQNESRVLGIEQRRELIERLIATGVPRIEIGSFVNPRVIPAMAGTDELARLLPRSDRTQYTALVPNVRGYEAAAEAGLRHVRLVVAASDEMNRRNFRASPAETMGQHADVARLAARDGIAIGGIIGTAFGCPYHGAVDPQAVVALAQQFAEGGADEIVLADTTGMATRALSQHAQHRLRQRARRAASGRHDSGCQRWRDRRLPVRAARRRQHRYRRSDPHAQRDANRNRRRSCPHDRYGELAQPAT
jgi:isopropylmalate/homocitrate/citramalate synthase